MEFNLIKIDGLDEVPKAVTNLVNKISAGAGIAYKPKHIRDVAKAEADAEVIRAKGNAAADMIRAKSKLEITDLQQRALERMLRENEMRQRNIEAIIDAAQPLLDDKAQPEKMDNDWVAHFFEKGRIVSDPEAQQLWAKVLAGEANSPGSFRKRTIELLGTFEKVDAELFTQLCGFCWQIGDDTVPLIFEHRHEIYTKAGVNFGGLLHLQFIGLIRFEATGGFSNGLFPKETTISYFDKHFVVQFPTEEKNELQVGHVVFTEAGYELEQIYEAKPVEGLTDFAAARWKLNGVLLRPA